MKKNSLILLALIVLVCLLSIRVFLLSKEIVKSEQNNVLSNEKVTHAEILYKNMIRDMSLEGTASVSKEFPIINTDYDTIDMNSLYKDSVKLVLLYKNISCKSCIEDEILRLQRKFGKDFRNILVLTAVSNPKEFAIFLRTNNIGIPIYFYYGDFFDSMFLSKGSLYFLVNDSGLITNIYFPIESDLTDMYLDKFIKIRQKLSK